LCSNNKKKSRTAVKDVTDVQFPHVPSKEGDRHLLNEYLQAFPWQRDKKQQQGMQLRRVIVVTHMSATTENSVELVDSVDKTDMNSVKI